MMGDHDDESEEKKDDAMTAPAAGVAKTKTAAKPSLATNNNNNNEMTTDTGSSWSTTTTTTTQDEKKKTTTNNVGSSSSNNNNKSSHNKTSLLPRLTMLLLLRTLVLDLPLLLVVGLYGSTFAMEFFAYDYLFPQMDLQETTAERGAQELTYFHRHCDASDLTATDTAELVVDPTKMSTDNAVEHMLKHGASVYPNLLTPETAKEVRDFILQQNQKNEDMIYVIENENRWSFGLRVDQHPSVAKALKEVLSNEFLVEAMEKIMGPDPAVIEFTGITSAYGAKIQRYHQDVVPEGNGAKWARNFVPSYSLFIPLQNVTAAMGATDLCPGSHMCADGCFDYCPEIGFQASGKADNWPMGWGALVNQQTMHRGAAHMDPNGPERVLFITTFAPRPRFGFGQVETRSIGQGGSYSLHWSQWGHTLRDFRDSVRHMKQPWRSLRALGLYKPRGRSWGWDYISQVSARIVNSETGFGPDDFYEFVDQGGFKFLPKNLQGAIPKDTDESGRQLWTGYLLDTFKRCQEALRRTYAAAVCTYLFLIISGSLLFSQRRTASIVSGFVRIAVIHGIVLLLAWLWLYRISISSWGKNIEKQRLYHWPSIPHKGAPSLYGTMPANEDIMVFDDMQSDYLASYNRVLDVFHPGNRAWFEMASNYSLGYKSLAPAMQKQLCSDMLRWSRQQGRRLLVKNDESNWAVAPDDMALRFCHKEMTKMADDYSKEAIRQLDFLLAETKFGYWRDTVMHGKHIPGRLRELQNRIMRFPFPTNATSTLGPLSIPALVKQPPLLSRVRLLLAPLPPIRVPIIPVKRRILSQEREVETPAHWIEEGDTVEASYGGYMVEWYRGEISGVNSDQMTWDVTYEDGDEEYDLCKNCVRHFVPYKKEEEVEWRGPEFEYFPCRVIAVDEEEETYDVKLIETDEVIEGVSPSELRRAESYPADRLQPGSRVEAMYPGEDGWYPGVLSGINSDKTYAIQFDDGDYLQQVDPRQVRPETEEYDEEYDE